MGKGKGKGGGKGSKGGKGKGGHRRRPRQWRDSSWQPQGAHGSSWAAPADWTLVERIKAPQRAPEGKAAWELFCNQYTNGRFDPSRTSPALLTLFLDQYESPGGGGDEDEG